MRNLLEETLRCLEKNGNNPLDVLWVGVLRSGRPAYLYGFSEPTVYFEWEEFRILAHSYYYEESDYAPNCNFPTNLVIVGEGWWIEPDSCVTQWVFKKYPQKPDEKIHPTSLEMDS